MYSRTILCLANSRKPPSGRCIAGKELKGPHAGHWLRPVSSRPTREVSEEERLYETGRRAQLLDIIVVPLDRPSPLGHQTENHILAEDYYWSKEGTATWAQVGELIDPYDPDFWLPAEDTRYGLNDKVPEYAAATIQSSLKLIAPIDLQIQVLFEEGFEGRPSRKRVRSHFDYHQQHYILSVTDPVMEDEFLTKPEGLYPVQTALLCISLAEPWNGYAFRLAASVITPDRCGG
jgi:hypothetical protein